MEDNFNMNFPRKDRIKSFCSIMILSAGLLLLVGADLNAANVQHFKMLSTVEYSKDDIQKSISMDHFNGALFRNQVETVFTVKHKDLFNNRSTKFFITSKDFDLAPDLFDPSGQTSFRGLSFVIDKNTGQISGADNESKLLEKVNNQCIKYLVRVTKDNIGKTWKQNFDLSLPDNSLPRNLKFTLKAIPVETKRIGEMIAVRAFSEPFVVEAVKDEGGTGSVKSVIKTVYLFDSQMEDVFLSISVLEAATTINGPEEKLRYEVATYKTDAAGKPVDLSGLGRKFENFVRKLDLTTGSFKTVQKSPLPLWALSECLGTAQVASICAATACEGDVNPVALICMPAARTLAMQSFGMYGPVGQLAGVGKLGSVSNSLGTSGPAIGSMDVAAAPSFAGMSLGTAGAVAGGTTAIAINAASDEKSASP